MRITDNLAPASVLGPADKVRAGNGVKGWWLLFLSKLGSAVGEGG